MGVVKGANNVEFNVRLKSGSTNKDQLVFVEVVTNTYTFYVGIARAPTGNCQLSSVAYMNVLLKHLNNKEDVAAVLREAYSVAGHTPQLIFMDVSQTLCQYIDSYFNVHTKTTYKSTNDSLMCLYLVRRPWN